MSVISQLNSPALFVICGSIIAFVAVCCLIFLVRAYRAGIAIGMDKAILKRVIVSSATFTVLPSAGIFLGVIALSGSLGTPLPWLRLSVIGALHYETQIAETAAEAVGLSGLSASEMTLKAFSTIALVMSFCIMWEMVFALLFNKRYLSRLKAPSQKTRQGGGFGDTAMTAMFIGLVSAYIGSYIGTVVSGSGTWIPLAVAGISACAIAVFIYLAEKKNAAWVESISIAGSMLIAMAAAVLLNML